MYKRQTEVTVKVGDVVLIHHDKKPKLHWPLGVITELHPGKDGLVRYVSLQTSRGITNRPLFKLYPLEISHEFESLPEKTENSDKSVSSNERPTRRAKEVAKQKIRTLAQDEFDSDTDV